MIRTPLHRRTGRAAALAAAALALTACAGPEAPLSVGAKQLASDITLGEASPTPTPVVVAPPPPSLPPFDIGGFVPPPAPLARNVPRPAPPRTRIVEACPPFKEEPALRSVGAPSGYPSAGTYDYRVDGTFARGGADASSGRVQGTAATTISDVEVTTTGYRWKQTSGLDGTITETTYEVLTRQTEYVVVQGAGDVAPRGVSPAGIYLSSIVTKAEGRPDHRFAPPSPGLKLYEFEATRGVEFDAAGTDPLTGETLQYRAVIGGGEHVNACGTALDSSTVDLEGTLSTDRQLDDGSTTREVSTFTARYHFALQFGGILISSSVKRERVAVAGGPTENLDLLTTINTVPAPVSGPLPDPILVDRPGS